MYKALLFDLDDTILDFNASADFALRKLFISEGIKTNQDNLQLYKKINNNYWKKMEKGEIKRDELLIKRFIDFYKAIGKIITYQDGERINEEFFSYLGKKAVCIPGAYELLGDLENDYKLFLISNGVKRIQYERLALIPALQDKFDKIFVSEEIGAQKPSQTYGDYILKHIPFKKKDMLIIGDSLTSDIKLGTVIGVDTCWYNPLKLAGDNSYTYEIQNISDLKKFI